jgi:hypothetical protein
VIVSVNLGVIPDEHEHVTRTRIVDPLALDLPLDAGIYSAHADPVHTNHDLDKVRDEIEVYNSLIPEPGELSATLLLEIEDQADLRAELLKFLGVDEAGFLKVGDKDTIRARFEEGRSREDKISAGQYVRFPLGKELSKCFN